MEIVPINEARYLKYEGCRQIIHDANARAFAEVKIGENIGLFALAWHSDLLRPIWGSNNGISWIGVDQRIVAIEEQTGRVWFSMTLPDNLQEILFGDRVVIIVCFTEIIMLNLDTSLRELRGVPDGVKVVRINKGRLEISTLEDDQIGIDL